MREKELILAVLALRGDQYISVKYKKDNFWLTRNVEDYWGSSNRVVGGNFYLVLGKEEPEFQMTF